MPEDRVVEREVAQIDYVFRAGETWRFWFQLGSEDSLRHFIPTDLSGVSASINVHEPNGKPLLHFTTAQNTLLVDGPQGIIEATLPFTASTVPWRSAVYELVITYPNGDRFTEAHGTVTIERR